MEEQLERVIDAPLPPPEDSVEQENQPRMPFPTAYQLTHDQEDELIEHAMRRLEELERETGRSRTGTGDWWLHGEQEAEAEDPENNRNRTERTWMGKRKLYDLVYQNDVEHRAHILGGIFADSNLVVPLSRKIARQMTARAVNYYFATDPWFAIYPVGPSDQELADKADRYFRWKLDQARVKQSLETGIERAFVLGESVEKTTWEVKQQVFKSFAVVLIGEDGNPVFAFDGDYIFEEDPWIETQVIDEETGEPIGVRMVLKRDGQTPQPDGDMIFEERLIERRHTRYRGSEARLVHFLDFLCPLDAESVQDADCVVHLYDMPVMALADQWRRQLEQEGSQSIEATRKAIDMIREMAEQSGEPKNAQDSGEPDPDTDAHLHRADRQDPVASIAEFWLRYDADGDGIMEEIMLVVDRNSRLPIFYDYSANVTSDGERPFSVIRVNEVPGRWYGIGAMEMFETTQQIIDLSVNRWNFGNSRAARVDFWKPHNTVEGRANPHLTLNWGGTYTPETNKRAEDCLESVYLENVKSTEQQAFMEFFIQLATNESGVANANDSQFAGLDSAELATGVRNIEKSGQELFSLYLSHLEPGISDVLRKQIRLLWDRLDELEVYRFFEGDEENGEGIGSFQEIDPADITDVELDVKVLLTRYRGEQVIESNVNAIKMAKDFYGLHPVVQERLMQLYRQSLKSLQVSDVDEAISPLPIDLMSSPDGMNPQAIAAGVPSVTRESEPNL